MWGYFFIAVGAFCCGFVTASVLVAARRSDVLRADDVLAEAVDGFAREHNDRDFDEQGRVSVARGQIEQLRQALAVHDQLRSL